MTPKCKVGLWIQIPFSIEGLFICHFEDMCEKMTVVWSVASFVFFHISVFLQFFGTFESYITKEICILISNEYYKHLWLAQALNEQRSKTRKREKKLSNDAAGQQTDQAV